MLLPFLLLLLLLLKLNARPGPLRPAAVAGRSRRRLSPGDPCSSSCCFCPLRLCCTLLCAAADTHQPHQLRQLISLRSWGWVGRRSGCRRCTSTGAGGSWRGAAGSRGIASGRGRARTPAIAWHCRQRPPPTAAGARSSSCKCSRCDSSRAPGPDAACHRRRHPRLASAVASDGSSCCCWARLSLLLGRASGWEGRCWLPLPRCRRRRTVQRCAWRRVDDGLAVWEQARLVD